MPYQLLTTPFFAVVYYNLAHRNKFLEKHSPPWTIGYTGYNAGFSISIYASLSRGASIRLCSNTLTSVVYSQGCKQHDNTHARVLEDNLSRHYICKSLSMQTFVYTGMCLMGMKHSLLLLKMLLMLNASRIIHDNTHILLDENMCLPSFRRSTTITSKIYGKHFSFIPIYVRRFNDKHMWHCREIGWCTRMSALGWENRSTSRSVRSADIYQAFWRYEGHCNEPRASGCVGE